MQQYRQSLEGIIKQQLALRSASRFPAHPSPPSMYLITILHLRLRFHLSQVSHFAHPITNRNKDTPAGPRTFEVQLLKFEEQYDLL